MTEPAPSPSGFDRQVALTRVGGDEDLLLELTGVFLDGADGWLNDLRNAAARGDAVALRRAGHTLKGSLSYFGADAAVAAAMRVEELAQAGDLAGAIAALPELEQALERLTAALRVSVSGQPSSRETPT